MRGLLALCGVALLSLSGCGYTTEERALSGAAIGALGGAVLGAATAPDRHDDRHYRRGRYDHDHYHRRGRRHHRGYY